jgi:hypothetical protein
MLLSAVSDLYLQVSQAWALLCYLGMDDGSYNLETMHKPMETNSRT